MHYTSPSHPVRRKHSEHGNTFIEFAVTFPVVLALFMGVFILGIGMVKAIQANQVDRNAGILFMKGLDMSQSGNQDILVRTAAGMNMTRTGGNGLIILSELLYVGDNECTAGGLAPGSCPNWDQYVVTKRIYIGNQALNNGGSTLASQLATPSSSILAADGTVTANASNVPYYLTDASTIANYNMVKCHSAGPTICAGGLPWGAFSFVAEVWFTMPELAFPSLDCFFQFTPGFATSSACATSSRALYSIYST